MKQWATQQSAALTSYEHLGVQLCSLKKRFIFQLKVRLFENLPPHIVWWITAKISHCALHGTMDNTMYYPWRNGIASTLPIWFLHLCIQPNGFVCARLHSVFTSTDTHFPYFASPSNDTLTNFTLLLFRVPQTLRAPCFVLTSFFYRTSSDSRLFTGHLGFLKTLPSHFCNPAAMVAPAVVPLT